MPKHEVTVIPGDGIGPEVIAATRAVLDAATSEIEWREQQAGAEAYARLGTPVPDEVVSAIHGTGVCLKGPLTNPGRDYPSPTRELRRALDLWCNVRIGEAPPRRDRNSAGLKLVIIRDTTEDLGPGAEQTVGPDAAIAIKFTTRAACERIAVFACGYAEHQGLTRVAIPNQATSLRLTDGMFVESVLAEARRHPELEVRGETLDVLMMHLVQDPSRYEVLVTSNFYGGFLCGLCAGLTGGVGLMSGACFGSGTAAIFEAAHGSAPHYAGQDKVNPTGMILSGAMLLEHIGLSSPAVQVRQAVAAVLKDGQHVTYDQGGHASTSEMARAVVDHIRK